MNGMNEFWFITLSLSLWLDHRQGFANVYYSIVFINFVCVGAELLHSKLLLDNLPMPQWV